MHLNRANAILRVPVDAEEAKNEIVERMERLDYQLFTEHPGNYGSGKPCIELHFRCPSRRDEQDGLDHSSSRQRTKGST